MNSLRFLSDWPVPLGLGVAIGLAALAWWLYWRESKNASAPNRWLLPSLRATAIFLLLMTFLEPVIHHRVRQGEPGKITFLVDASESMAVEDDPTPRFSRSRYRRAAELLLSTDDTSLQKLAEEFEVSIRRLDGAQPTVIWEATAASVPELTTDPDAWRPSNWSATSPLGDSLIGAAPTGLATSSGAAASGLLSSVSNASRPSESVGAKSVIVLLSDGQSNAGSLPIDVASQLANQQQVVYTIGFGANAEAADLKLDAVNYPRRAFRSDILRGTLEIQEQLGKGQAYDAMIFVDNERVWEKQLVSLGTGMRSVEFTVPLAPLYDRLRDQLPENADYAVLPLQLEARVKAASVELNESNNAQQMYLTVAAQRSRILVIDGRSRWELRYLRNMFERDPAWQIDTLIASEPETFQFPKTRDDLFQYDLILLGDVPSDMLSRDQQSWLREFVELSGGGLVVIAGSRHHLAEQEYSELHRMLPIKWGADGLDGDLDSALAAPSAAGPKRAVLTSTGQALSALRIDPTDETASEDVWKQLPAVQFVDRVEVLPGAETLAMATTEAGELPLIVTRRFGAGRVLFMGTDETWRWRYKVADVVHQRLWNQLARWVMRTPMAVQSEFVSLDSGAASYELGDSIELRAQLRDPSGRPSPGRSPTALVTFGDRLVARVPLTEDPNIAGSYSAELTSQPAGDYRIGLEAAGFSRDALDVHTNFAVVGQPSIEMQQVACDDQLLRGLAERTGGKYLHETEAAKLLSLLRPLSSGRFIESDTILWQTYWWFAAAMVLLVCEWWLRKRAGLV